MGDTDKNKNKATIDRQQAGSDTRYQDFNTNLKGQTATDQASANEERANLYGKLNPYATTGGITDEMRARLGATTDMSMGGTGGSGGGGGGGGGGEGGGGASGWGGSAFNQINLPGYGESLAGYRNFAATGGVDLTRPMGTFGAMQGQGAGLDWDSVHGSISDLKGFGQNAGVSQEELERINRPLFEEFERTGGYSDPQRADIRGRANSTLPAFYGNMQDELANRRLTSGYGGGFDAASRNLTREAAVGATEQARNTEIDLQEKINAGRMGAGQQIASNQLALTGITTPAKLAAMSSAGQLGLGEQDIISRTKIAAAQGDIDAQRLLQSGKLAGLGGITGIETQGFQNQATKAAGLQQYQLAQDQMAAQRAAAGSMAGAFSDAQRRQLQAQNERFLIQQQQGGMEFGMGGLQDLYTSKPGALTSDYEMMLQSMREQNFGNQGYDRLALDAAAVPSGWEKAVNYGIQGAGAAAGAFAGFGGTGGSSGGAGWGAQAPQYTGGWFDQNSGQYGPDWG